MGRKPTHYEKAVQAKSRAYLAGLRDDRMHKDAKEFAKRFGEAPPIACLAGGMSVMKVMPPAEEPQFPPYVRPSRSVLAQAMNPPVTIR